MLEELQRRNYSQSTIESYLHAVEDFARYFGKRPDLLNLSDIRQYQLHPGNDRKLAVNTIVGRISTPDHTQWVRPRYPFYLPVKVLSRVFRGKFVAGLRRAFRRQQLHFGGSLKHLADP